MSFIDAKLIADRLNDVIAVTGRTQFNVGSFQSNIPFMADFSDGHSWVERLENEIIMVLVISMLKDISYPTQNQRTVQNELTEIGMNIPNHTLTNVSVTTDSSGVQAGVKGEFGNWKVSAKSFGITSFRNVTAQKTKLVLENSRICKVKTEFALSHGHSWDTYCVNWRNTQISQTADFATCNAELKNLHMLWKLAV